MGYFKNPLELSAGLAASPEVFTSSLRFPTKELRVPSPRDRFHVTSRTPEKWKPSSASSAHPLVSQPPGKSSLPIYGVITWPTASPSWDITPGPCHHPSLISAKSDDDRSLTTHSFRVIFLQCSPRWPGLARTGLLQCEMR